MFATTQAGRITQRVVFMLLSVTIVSAFLSLGAYGAEFAQCEHYSVTITQLS